MHVGIITAHWAHNYGAMLQAFALQKTIEGLGHRCEIIDFMTDYQERCQSFFPPARSRRIKTRLGTFYKSLKNLPRYKTWRCRAEVFEDFKNTYLHLTEDRFKTCKELEENGQCFDACICGSDQIWRSIEGSATQFDPAYYLCFVNDEFVRRIAYAPSFGADFVPDALKTEYARRILAIPYLSVRESQGQKIIRELTGKTVPVVLDPTLLLKRQEWAKVISEPAMPEPYILVYLVAGNPHEMGCLIANVKKKTGLSKVVALTGPATRRIPNVDMVVPTAHPLEFLGWISNAAYVCTSSFHGMVFSFIFRRPFFTIMPHRISSRIVSLASLLNLESRLITQDSAPSEISLDIDFSKSEVLHEKERLHSLEYLESALGMKTT